MVAYRLLPIRNRGTVLAEDNKESHEDTAFNDETL